MFCESFCWKSRCAFTHNISRQLPKWKCAFIPVCAWLHSRHCGEDKAAQVAEVYSPTESTKEPFLLRAMSETTCYSSGEGQCASMWLTYYKKHLTNVFGKISLLLLDDDDTL